MMNVWTFAFSLFLSIVISPVETRFEMAFLTPFGYIRLFFAMSAMFVLHIPS